MTDHPNLETARAGYAAFAVGDMATINDLLADDVVWHSGGDNVLTGDYEGKEAVLGYMARLMQETGGTFRNEIHDMLANDEHGVALVNATGERNGKMLDAPIIHVFHMRDGKMTEFWSVGTDQAVLDDFWAVQLSFFQRLLTWESLPALVWGVTAPYREGGSRVSP